MKKVFISYGRDSLSFFPTRVSEDLIKTERFETIIDQRMECAVKFDDWIQDRIDESDLIIFFMTKHSTRRHDSVCLDEIAYARSKSIQIIPVLLEECSPPLLVSRINWLDARDCINVANKTIIESRYNERLNQIIKALDDGGFDDELIGNALNLKKKLQPFDFSLILSERNDFFTERHEFTKFYNEWIESDNSVLWIAANAGSGKSVLCSHLANEDVRVKGIHFCKNFSTDTGLARRIMTHLAFNIFTQNEQYGKSLEENVDFSAFVKNDTTKVFYDLFVKCTAPLEPSEPYILIIDGLDEAPSREITELSKALFENRNLIPKWLKFIITSRPDLTILQSLSFLRKYDLLNNKDDILAYIQQICLAKNLNLSQQDVDQIVDLSQGNYLYVKTLFDLNGGSTIDLETLKSGMSSIFSISFSKFFSEEEFVQLPRQLLQILVAAKDSLDVETISEIMGIGHYELNNLLKKFGTLLNSSDAKITLYHKALGDWLTSQDNINYFVSSIEGDKQICLWIKNNPFGFMFNDYIRKYGFDHLFNTGDFETIFSALKNTNQETDDSLCLTLVHNAVPNKYSAIAKFIYEGFKNDPKIFPIAKIIRYFVEYGCFASMRSFFANFFIRQNKEIEWIIPYSDLITNRMQIKIEEAYKTPEDLFKNAPDDVYAEYFYYRAEASRELGKYKEALKLYEKAAETSSSPDRFAHYMSLIKIADIYFVFGDNPKALEKANSVVLADTNFEGNFAKERVLGHIYRSMGNRHEAILHYENALNIAKDMGKMYAIVESYNSLATVLDDDTAVEYLLKVISLCKAHDYKLELGKAYSELGNIYLKRSDINNAIECGLNAKHNQETVKYLGGICQARRLLIRCYLQLHDYQKALPLALSNIEDMLNSHSSLKTVLNDIRLYHFCQNGLGIYEPFDANLFALKDKITDEWFYRELEKNTIVNAVLKEFNSRPSSDYKIGYHNQNHTVSVNGAKYILRIPVEDFDTVDIHVFNENDVLNFLDEINLSVDHPHFIGNGILNHTIVSVHSFIEGKQLRATISDNKELTNNFVLQFAQIMATFHSCRTCLPSNDNLYSTTKSFYAYDYSFISNLVNKWFLRYQNMYIKMGFPTDINLLLASHKDEIFENITCLNHCDLHRGNVLLKDDGKFAIIDWELTQFTDPLYDVAIHLHKMFYSEEQEKIFLDEYFSHFQYDRESATRQIENYRRLEEVKSCVIDIIRLVHEFGTMSKESYLNACEKYIMKLKVLEKEQEQYKSPFKNKESLYQFIEKKWIFS